MSDYSVHNEPDFARTYDEDEQVTLRKGDLRACLDIATQSMDFGSGFLCEEEVEALRKIATILGVDPLLATPANFTCKYRGEHEWVWHTWNRGWWCRFCSHTDTTSPAPEGTPLFHTPKDNGGYPVWVTISTQAGLEVTRILGYITRGDVLTTGSPNAIPDGEYRMDWALVSGEKRCSPLTVGHPGPSRVLQDES